MSTNIFILLNSVEFCNKNIYSTPQNTPFLTTENFWYGNGVIVLLFTLILHFTIPEKSCEESFDSPWKVFRSIILFYKNPNLWTMVVILMTQYIGLAPIYTFGDTVLL